METAANVVLGFAHYCPTAYKGASGGPQTRIAGILAFRGWKGLAAIYRQI